MEEVNKNTEVDNTDKKLHISGVISSDIRRYVGSICDECGEMSNHDDIDEDICIHCKTSFGSWKHIYEPPN
jgi:formylmethanofuran dehydrogenase subunit E